jgi:O-antigen/teichoic acid export membrane protein
MGVVPHIEPRPSGRANLIANAVGRVWALAANVVMFPVYLRLLGQENFGIVAVLAAVTSIVALFDFGLTPVFARELHHQARSPDSRRDLLRTAELVFLGIVVSLMFCVLLAPAAWLAGLVDASAVDSPAIASPLRWVFAVAAAQLLLNFYVSAMSGIERQVQSNAVNVGAGMLRSVGVLLPLLVWPAIEVFLWWQLAATVAGALTARWMLFGMVANRHGGARPRFSVAEIRACLPAARASFLLASAATLNMNLDRLFVSHFGGLTRIAEYTIATTFAQLIFIASVPISMTATPRMVRAVTGGDPSAFDDWLTMTRTAIGLSSGFLMVAFLRHGPALIEHWSGGAVRAAEVGAYSAWLFVGAASLAVSAIYHCVATAHSDFSFGRVYVFSLLVVVPVYALAVRHHGVAGAAMAWGCTQLAIMLAYRAWVNARLLNARSRRAAPWVGLLIGGLAGGASGLLLSPWSSQHRSFGATLLAFAAEAGIALALCLVALVAWRRRLASDDGLAIRASEWIRSIGRRPTLS